MTFVQLTPFLKNPIGIFSRGKKVPREKIPIWRNGKNFPWEKFPTGKINIEIYVQFCYNGIIICPLNLFHSYFFRN